MKSFILYTDTIGIAIANLSKQQLGDLLTGIYKYQMGEEYKFETDSAKLMFDVIKKNLEDNAAKYDKLCESRRNAWERKRHLQTNSSVPPPTPPPKESKPKPISPHHANYDWVDEKMKDIWQEWLDYKRRDKRSTYQTERSIKIAYNQMIRLAGNNPETARLIVEQSIANNYAGLFELKQSNTNNNGSYINRNGNNKLSEHLNRIYNELEENSRRGHERERSGESNDDDEIIW